MIHEFGLRNLDNNLKMSEVSNNLHEISDVMTSAVYQILLNMYDDAKDSQNFDLTETLFWTAQHFAGLILIAVKNTSKNEITYSNFAEELMKVEAHGKWRSLIKKEFEKREVLGKHSISLSERFSGSKVIQLSSSCGTLHFKSKKAQQFHAQSLSDPEENLKYQFTNPKFLYVKTLNNTF